MANLSSYLPGGIDPAAVAITGGTINGTTIGASTAAAGTFTTLTATAASTITTADNNPQLTLISTDADASEGPVLKLYRNSGSPADNDILGRIQFSGEDDAGNDSTFGRIDVVATDVSNNSEDARMEFSPAVGDAFTPTMSLTGGKVGIGTTSPSYPLSVVTSSGSAYLYSSNGTTNAFIGADASNTALFGSSTNHPTRFMTNNTERMRIDSSGNVGIGAASPSSKLHVNGSFRQTGATAPFEWTVNSGALDYYKLNAVGYADNLIVANSGGNVGIGTASPKGELEVDGLIVTKRISGTPVNSSVGGFAFNRNGTAMQGMYLNTSDQLFIHNSLGNGKIIFSRASGAETMRLNQNGQVTIGTTSASLNSYSHRELIYETGSGSTTAVQGLYKNSTAGGRYFTIYHNPNGAIGSVSNSATSVSYNTTSDVRLKENIVDAPAGNIDAIRVRSFDWKVNGSHQTYGMVAQELVDVAPEAVSQGETEDNMWQVDYSKLVPMMIKEIQDLKAEVAALKGA
jgi:hypothetical protein